MDEAQRKAILRELARRELARREETARLAEMTGAPEDFVLNPETGQMVDMRSPNNPYVSQGRDQGNRALSAAAGTFQGSSLGWGDEIVGAGRAALGGEGTFSERQDFETERMREEVRRARENNPVMAYGGELAGGVASSLAPSAAVARGTQGMGMGGQMAGGGLLGLIEGALYGSGSADDGDRLRGGLLGGALGGGIGAAAVPAVAAASAVARPVADAVAARLGIGNSNRAASAVARRMRNADVSADDLRRYLAEAAQDGQPEFAVADAIGFEGQRALSGVVRTPGPGRQAVVEALDARQLGQGARVGDNLREALNVNRTARNAGVAMRGERAATARPRYAAARADAGPVDVRGALGVIDERIGGMRGSGVTGDSIDGRLAGFRNRLATDDATTTLSDFNRVLGVKQDVQDAIGAAQRAGRNNEARELTRLAQELDGALEASSPSYRAANDAFRRDSVAIEQLEAGNAAAGPNARMDDITAEFQALPPSPTAPGPGVGLDARQAYREGYANPVAAALERQVDGGDATRQFRNPKARGLLDAMSDDPGLFRRRNDREFTMFETRRLGTGGSQTSTNDADSADMVGAQLGPLVQSARDVGNFQVGSVFARIMEALAGENDATKKMIADMLLSNDPAILSPVQRAVGSETFRRGLLEAIARQSNRPATEALR